MGGAVLLDLDGTVLDTSGIDRLREQRQWKQCVASRESTSLFQGIDETLVALRRSGFSVAIVTSSVSYYAENLLSYHQVEYDALVAYHDTSLHKPHPHPYQRALELLEVSAVSAIGVGDKAEDALSLTRCGVLSIAAGWNSSYEESDSWNSVIFKPSELVAGARHRGESG